MNIPINAIKYRDGLYLNSYYKNINGNNILFRHLYADKGYKFYDITEEIFDENSNKIANEEIKINQRLLLEYVSLPVTKDIRDFIPVKESEIEQV